MHTMGFFSAICRVRLATETGPDVFTLTSEVRGGVGHALRWMALVQNVGRAANVRQPGARMLALQAESITNLSQAHVAKKNSLNPHEAWARFQARCSLLTESPTNTCD